MNYYGDPYDMEVMVAVLRRALEVVKNWPCHYDPLLPPLFGATDITAAETRLKEIPAQRYRRLEYGALTTILPKRS